MRVHETFVAVEKQ